MKRKIELSYMTDAGNVRPKNEDRATSINFGDIQLLVVCDGMGGHHKGEVASELALDIIASSFENSPRPTNEYRAKKMIKKVMKDANSAILKLASNNELYADMGTTVVMAVVLENETIIANCGDSRAYTFSTAFGLTQVTNDQSYVQYLYDTGKITKEEMQTHPKKHVLMNAMGINPSISYDIYVVNNDYDYLLLSSDGFTNMVSKNEIEQLLSLDVGVKEKVKMMVVKALGNGGTDNIAVNLMEVNYEDR